MNPLELAIRRLTQPLDGQYPRPWMTGWKCPDKVRVFVVGYNQATGYDVERLNERIGGHDAYVDALFNRNGRSCDRLYGLMRSPKACSPARKNIYRLRKHLSELGIDDVLETNVICFGTPMAKDVKGPSKSCGEEIFRNVLTIVRPVVVIAHGVGTKRELENVLESALPDAAAQEACGVKSVRIDTRLQRIPYAPLVFTIPSLAPPKWNRWKSWAQPHLLETCARVKDFLDNQAIDVRS